MAKIPAKVTNERREKVWFLMLKGHNAPAIGKTLQSPTDYNLQRYQVFNKKE